MKKVMILGAGISQVPLIQTARNMGLYTVVVSRQGAYPGFELADRYYYIDTTNLEMILDAARLEGIDGICTTGTDVAVRAVGHTADALGLPGVSLEAALLCSNKLQMKKKFVEHGIRTAGYVTVWNKQEAVEAFLRLEAPVIFKAVDSGASKGIVIVDRPEDIEEAYNKVASVTRQPYFIVEEYITGVEFGAQAFVHNDEVQFIMPHGDMVFQGDAGVPVGHYVPYPVTNEVLQDIEWTIRQCVQALKLNHCAVNADFILKDNRVYVLEVGARAGATCLPELVSTFYDFNYYEQMLLAAIGETPSFPSQGGQPCACELMLSHTGGRIVRLDNSNPPNPDIVDIALDYRQGDIAPKFRVGTDRLGHVVVKGSTMQQVWKTMEAVKNRIVIETAG
jgi:biotin carboxylase